MNIVDFWQRQVEKWDAELKCGLCWAFGAPLIESSVNIQQPTIGKECCVKVMFLQDKGNAFTTQNSFANTGYVNQVSCATNFQLLVLVDSKLGVNNFNEVKGHSNELSNWNMIMNPLQECLSCDANLDFCELLGSSYRVTNWSGQQVINYLDSVYCGYRISVTFQKVT